MSSWPEPRLLIDGAGDNLQVKEDVASALETIRKPLVVVCIAGPYRTGKSYLMNHLANRQTGFALGSTVESKTKGIWVWYVDHPLDEEKGLLLMDTEGLGDAFKGNETYDMWICCLAVLLCSVFVYNIVGKIDSGTINKLDFASEMSKHIRARNSDGASDMDFDEFFPSFILAIRDFFLKPELDGKPVTSDEYMERMLLSLKKQEKPTEKEKERVAIKQKLRAYFKRRKCFFFPRPVASDDKLSIVETLEENELDPLFLSQVKMFCNHIFTTAPVKKLDHTRNVDGRR